jgi:hypothetical protein
MTTCIQLPSAQTPQNAGGRREMLTLALACS